jgi:hypothetical protein
MMIFCRSQSAAIIVLGVVISLFAQCLLVFHEKPAMMEDYDIDVDGISNHNYNIVDLVNAPQSSGWILKYKSYVVTKSIFSSLLIRKILNSNGILEVRRLASSSTVQKLPPIHYPIHKSSKKHMKTAHEWNEQYYNEIYHNGINVENDHTATMATKTPTNRQYYSIMDYHNVYKSGNATPTDVMERLLEGMEKLQHLHVFASYDSNLIRQQATQSTKRWSLNQPISIWDGVPVAIKDMSPIRSLPLCDGSSQCTFEDDDDYPAMQLRHAGAILVGTTVMTGTS